MKIEAAQIDWNLEHIKEVNDCWDVFHNMLKTLESKYVPMKKATNTMGAPPWMDKRMRNMLSKRQTAWTYFKKTNLPGDYSTYQVQRNQCKYMLRSKRKSYERTLVEQVKTAPRRIFTYINRRLKKTDDLLVLKTSTNIPVKDNTGRANLFAEHY